MKHQEDKPPTIAQQRKSIRMIKLTIERLKSSSAPADLLKAYETSLQKAEGKLKIAEERSKRSTETYKRNHSK